MTSAPLAVSQPHRPSPSWDWSGGDLRVSTDGRSFVHRDGRPFLWLADTAWELLHRCTRAEITTYLDVRVAQGFTVIQTVALAELDGLHTANAEGNLPFLNDDPTQPVAAYWDLVDWTLAEAKQRGLLIALLPTWGDKVCHWGIGPRIFNPARAGAYGIWLGERYRDHGHLVWVLGGDRSPTVDLVGGDRQRLDPTVVAIWRAMAAGLRAGDHHRHLITFHPWGQDSSGMYWHSEDWLDFNSQQNGHDAHPDVWNRIANDRMRSPAKPVIDLEPAYEDIPLGFDHQRHGWGSAWNVRWFAWIEMLAGACGHTYGCNGVWQMYAPGRHPACFARLPWQESLHLPGAWDMGHLRDLLMSRPFPLEPNQNLLIGSAGRGGERLQAAWAKAGGWAVVYSGQGEPITLDLTLLGYPVIHAWWYDPRTGVAQALGTVPAEPSHGFTPPSRGQDHDWVLVLDDATRGFASLGTRA